MRTQIKIVVMAILTIAFALGAAVMPAMAAESDGSFDLNNVAPVVGAITLYDAAGTEAVTDGIMIPQIYYNVSMVVSDENTLNDLTEIKVEIQDAAYVSTNSVSQKATYKWTPGGGWVEDSRPGNPNTWGEITAAECIVPELTELTGTWYVKFMPGKVAKEVAWKVTVTATDVGTLNHNNVKTGLSMGWYGEITAVDTTFSFGAIGLAASDTVITTPDDGKVDFTTITNGDYKLQSKTVDWAYLTTTLTLDPDGAALADGSFALKNNGTATVGTANSVTTGDGTITGDDNLASNLAESGNAIPVYMWLTTATHGIMPYTYTGTYTLTISNN